MNMLLTSFLHWLADYYLLSTVLLVLAALVLVCVRQPAKRRAVTQSTLAGLILLAALCALPGWSVLSLTRTNPVAPVENGLTEPVRVVQAPVDTTRRIVVPPPMEQPNGIPMEAVEPASQTAGAAADAPPRSIPWRWITMIAWATGAALTIAWLVLGWTAACRLRRDSQPAPGYLLNLLRSLTSSHPGRSQNPELRVSTQIDVAVALGVVHPAVLLPADWLETQSGDELHTVLAHEAAHLRNYDLHWLAVSRALSVVLWAQPLYWFLRRRMRLDQEALADAAAAELTSRHDYAEKLVALAHQVSARPAMRLSTAVGLWEGPSQLRLRVALLMDEHFTVLRQCSSRWRFSAALFAIVATLGLSVITLDGQSRAESKNDANADSALKNDPPRAVDAAGKIEASASDSKNTKTPPKVAFVSLRVRVETVDGKPVDGATVAPRGLRLAQRGAFINWSKPHPILGTPGSATTDASGFADVRYPAHLPEGSDLQIGSVYLKVNHPEFVTAFQDANVRESTPTIQLTRGGRVEITATMNGEVVRDDIFGQGGQWQAELWTRLDDGTLRSPRMPAGEQPVRAVWLLKDGPAHFSDVTTVNVVENETQSIKVELRPGTRLSGKLDDAVPRPVKNGKVITLVDRDGHVDWYDWTTIKEDGTFEFASLPGGEGITAQLIALADGYVSKPPGDPSERKPQSVPLDGAVVSHVIETMPTATARVTFTEHDGRPIPGVRLSLSPNVTWSMGSTLFGQPQWRTADVLRNESNDELLPSPADVQGPFTATSDDRGIAEIQNVPAFESSIYAVVQHERFQLPATAAPIEGARMAMVNVKPGETTKLEMVLEPTAAAIAAEHVAETELAGTVLGPDGKPLAGVDVDVWTWHPGNETKTDDRGRFRLKGFEPGEHVEVEFTKAGYEPRYFFDQTTGEPGMLVQMDNRTFLEGTMTDAAGKPVGGAVVRAERGPFENPQGIIGEVATETQTDDDGRYRLYLEPSIYAIKVRAAGRGVARFESVNLGDGEQKPFDIRLQEGITFRAKIVDSETGKPVPGIRLFNWRLKDINEISNDEGIVEITGLFPGKLEFNVRGDEKNYLRSSAAGNYARWWSERAVHEHQRKRTERDGFQRNFDDLEFDIVADMEPVTIYAEPCVTITGRVVDPDGNPVAGATVAPAKTGTGNSLTGDTRFSYATNKDGTFEAKLPASGDVEYNLIAHDGKYNEWRRWANAVGEPFSTKPGQRIEGVEMKLQRPATIRGRVLQNGEPASAGVQVRAADVLNRDNRYYVPTTKTDEEGRFELKFVRPGKFYLQAEPFWLNPAEAPTGSEIVDVEEGATIDEVEINSAQ